MRRALALVSLIALSAGAATASAQAKANFAGTWTVVADPNAPAPQPGRGGGGGMLGQGATITQDAKVLTITRTTPNGEVKSSYNLDGTESKNTMMGRGGAMETTSLTKWDGNKFIVTTSQSMGGNPVTITTTLWLDANGNLVAEIERPGQGGTPVKQTMTYKKG